MLFKTATKFEQCFFSTHFYWKTYMIVYILIASFLLRDVSSAQISRGIKHIDTPAKEAKHSMSKATKNSVLEPAEIPRKLSVATTQNSEDSLFNEKYVTPKYTCPPGDLPEIDESDYSDCKKMVEEGLYMGHPDQNKLTLDFLEMYGYPYLEYRVTTKDNYILTVYRITGSPKLNSSEAHKTPIYINHGLIGASDWWFFLPAEKTLVFMMADEGYDVWISNARGTTYSLEHETLDYNKSLEYWDFSFHEMGLYDVPAVTDMMLAETGQSSILYLGYSMGSTELFVSVSEMPEMSSKIKAAFMFAPATYMGHTTSAVFRNLAAVADTEEAYQALNVALKGRIQTNQEVRQMIKLAGSDICALSTAKCGLCDNAWYFVNGMNARQLNKSALPLILEKAPNSASVKTFAHYAQMITTCRFQKFDYSPSINLKLYGSTRPPLYDLKKFKSPLYIYYGEQDNLVLPIDIQELISHFREGVVQKSVLIADRLFNHLDFCSAKDADKLVYNGLLHDMRKYIEWT